MFRGRLFSLYVFYSLLHIQHCIWIRVTFHHPLLFLSLSDQDFSLSFEMTPWAELLRIRQCPIKQRYISIVELIYSFFLSEFFSIAQWPVHHWCHSCRVLRWRLLTGCFFLKDRSVLPYLWVLGPCRSWQIKATHMLATAKEKQRQALPVWKSETLSWILSDESARQKYATVSRK